MPKNFQLLSLYFFIIKIFFNLFIRAMKGKNRYIISTEFLLKVSKSLHIFNISFQYFNAILQINIPSIIVLANKATLG
jgi:hypothetical protein